MIEFDPVLLHLIPQKLIDSWDPIKLSDLTHVFEMGAAFGLGLATFSNLEAFLRNFYYDNENIEESKFNEIDEMLLNNNNQKADNILSKYFYSGVKDELKELNQDLQSTIKSNSAYFFNLGFYSLFMIILCTFEQFIDINKLGYNIIIDTTIALNLIFFIRYLFRFFTTKEKEHGKIKNQKVFSGFLKERKQIKMKIGYRVVSELFQMFAFFVVAILFGVLCKSSVPNYLMIFSTFFILYLPILLTCLKFVPIIKMRNQLNQFLTFAKPTAKFN